ncbi:hypothetical protein [Halosimplex salinum]|uniref:hypothetical protein n=1 Tax=Halosimplex salinum TaxID=1710538 RepID=UPI000F47F88D|nr:hypothetical protein [Halosimplex salinum]
MAANADPPEQGDIPCTDRLSAGESCGAPAPNATDVGTTDDTVDHTPETLYLVRIATLEARVAALERSLESKERDLQHVVDRYEHVLQERDACRDEPLVTDESIPEPTTDHRGPTADRADRTADPGALGRLRELFR